MIGHARFTAVHKATGNPIDTVFSLSAICRDDRIVEALNVVDYVDLLLQMDMIDRKLLERAFAG